MTASLQGVRPLNKYPGYDIQLSDYVAPVLGHWEMWNTPSLPLLPGPLCPEVVVPVRFPPLRQIKLFNHLLYLKPFQIWGKTISKIVSSIEIVQTIAILETISLRVNK